MKKALKIIGIALIVILIGAAIAWFGFLKPDPPPISSEDRQQIGLMPLPASLEINGGKVYVNSHLNLSYEGISTERLDRAFKRFESRLMKCMNVSEAAQDGVEIRIRCDSVSARFPNLKEDESYHIKINGDHIELSASQERGVFHGLETLFQLLKKDEQGWYLPELEMDDSPRYPWRGLMIDVSRHWIPKQVIFRNLDAMAAVKMNVLHLHLTDHQGFRIESKVFPKLHELGSEGDYYSQDEIRDILDYAADRGIRIVPEFDVPGHTASWFPGYPELASDEGSHVIYRGIIGDAIMNPSNDYTFDFLNQLFAEMASLFPDDYFHVGADEPRDEDWNNNEEIQEFMKSKGFSDNHALYSYFNQRLFDIVQSQGKKLLGWDEIQDAGLPADEIGIQSWRNHKSLWSAARQGSHAILSAGYYLDHKQSAAFHYDVDPEIIKGAINIEIDSTLWQSWKMELNFNDTKLDGELYMFGANENRRGVMGIMGNLYGFDKVRNQGEMLEYDIEGPMGTATFELQNEGDSLIGESSISVFTLNIKGFRSGGSDMSDGLPLPEFEKIEPLTESQRKNLLGGEACMWTEAADSVILESRIWPRSGAIAEKLWSPQELTDDTNDMYRRLLILNDLLEEIGLQHMSYRQALVLNRVDDRYRKPLDQFVDLLREDLLFNRMVIYDPPFDVDTPLNRIVDGAAPESYAALRFEMKVDEWLENKDLDLKEEIRSQLYTWSSMNKELRPAFAEYPFLKEVEPHAQHLSRLAELALIALGESGGNAGSMTELDAILLDARKAYGGTLLSVVSGLEKLIKETGSEVDG